jgi:uncharacterized repeat protein (TIGR01451 family)
MIKSLLIISILLFFYKNIDAQVFTVEKKTIYSDNETIPTDIHQSPNGTYYCVGHVPTFVSNNVYTYKSVLLKLMNSGDTIWSKVYDGNGDRDLLNKVIATGDGNYLCFGETNSTTGIGNGNHGGKDIWIMKVDPSGNIIWSKTYGGTNDDLSVGITRTSDDNFVVASSTLSNNGDVQGYHGTSGSDIWMFKINQQGNLLWSKCFGNDNSNDISSNPVNHNDRTVILVNPQANGTQYPLVNGRNNYLVNLDMNGNIISSNLFNEPNEYPGYPLYNTVYQSTIVKANGKLFFHCVATDIKSFYDPVTPYIATQPRFFIIDENRNYLNQSLVSAWFGGGANFTRYYADKSFALTTDDRLLFLSQKTSSFEAGNLYLRLGSIYGSNFSELNVHPWLETTQATLNYNEFSRELLVLTRQDGQIGGGQKGFKIFKYRPININTIKGKVYLDKNSNNIKESTEPYFTAGFVKSTKPGFAKQSWLTQDGSFSNLVDTGSFTSNLVFTKAYYTANPLTKTTTFTTNGNKDSFDFALQPIPNKKDLVVSLMSQGPARPGFDVSYKIDYKNVGTETLSGTIKLVKANKLTFLNAQPSQATIVVDTITWNYSNLSPDSAGSITINLKVIAPPVTNNGDTLKSSVTINPFIGDETTIDNTSTLNQIVTGAYDPNDKREAHGGYFTPAQVANKENLLYTIRFQNTGTDTAFNIRVTDTLDTKLDWASLEMVSASHPYKLEITNGNKCAWFFSNILLPDSTRNEAASHGYITYRIKPKNTVILGDTIKNSASIFFDFNTPIVTNVEKTVIGSQVPSALLPVPEPIVNGLNASYCSNTTVQQGKAMNLPNSSYVATYQIKLDNTITLNLAPDSTFNFNVNTLALGQHTIDVSYTNALGTKIKTYIFLVNATFTPNVILSSTPTNASGNITLTATNQSGGGNNPLYTYATDRNFTTIIQPEGTTNTLSVTASSLPIGLNWFYVKMKTSELCFSRSTDIDSVMIPIVDAPQTSIIKNEYCSNEGTQTNSISNITSPNYASTTTVKLDNNAIAINNGQFTFNPATLAFGTHTLTITFSNVYITKTITKSFTIKETVNPTVQVSTSKTSITQNEIAVLTSTPSNAGANPLYLFALDNAFTNVLQAESINNILNLNANTLAPGLYTIYTRIKTTQNCYSKLYHVDSVSIKRNGSLNILDRSNVITITPNPFNDNININGLDISKAYIIELVDNNGKAVYKQKVNNQYSHRININLPKSIFLLRINNMTDNSKLKSVRLIKG